MVNKKGNIIMIKFLISTLIAVLIFWFLTTWACSRMPLIHDRADKTIRDVEGILTQFDQDANFLSYPLILSKDKAFYFFENSSNRIYLYDIDSNKRHYINKNPSYCPGTDPCFCYCDDFVQISGANDCALQLDCKRHKLSCQTFENEFTFNQLGNKFFMEDEGSEYLVFKGGFFLSENFQDITFHVQRTSFLFQKRSDVIHLCARQGDCIFEDSSEDAKNLINTICII